VDVGAHGLGGVDPFCQGVEEEREFDLLQERLFLALIFACLADVGEPAPLATLEGPVSRFYLEIVYVICLGVTYRVYPR
jgi:hypothetical protein